MRNANCYATKKQDHPFASKSYDFAALHTGARVDDAKLDDTAASSALPERKDKGKGDHKGILVPGASDLANLLGEKAKARERAKREKEKERMMLLLARHREN